MNPAYLLSLPERLLRAAAALLGGTFYELSLVVLPRWLRNSQFYQAVIERFLRIIIEFLGDVRGVFPEVPSDPSEFATRKMVGNAVEAAGFLAMGLSPLWLMAAVADITGGARIYLQTLKQELQAQGVLESGDNIETFEELLDSLSDTSGLLASSMDMPPMQREQIDASLVEIRANWEALQTRTTAALPGPRTLARLFGELQETAQREQQLLLDVSQQIAVGAVRAGFLIGQAHIFDYYAEALRTIADEGLSVYSRRVSKPYLTVARRHFDTNRSTLTERVIRRLTPSL